ncbi:MAG: site-specific integrase [Gillisia sp.]
MAVDKRYYVIDIQEGGRRVRLSTGTKDREAASRKEQLVLDMLRADETVTDDTLREAIRGKLRAAKIGIRHASGMTLKQAGEKAFRDPYTWGLIKRPDAVESNMGILMRILGPDMPLKSITRSTINDLVQKLLAGEGHSPRRAKKPRSTGTVNRKLGTLASLLHAAVQWEPAPIDSVPPIKMLEEHGEREFVFSHEEERALLQSVLDLDLDAVRGPQTGGRPRRRDGYLCHALYVVLAETGFRHSEALGLTWEDIDFATGVIRLIDNSKLKTKASIRMVPMTPRCRDTLKSEACMKGHPKGPFEGLSIRRSQQVWKEAKKRAGITHKDAVPHALRHTAATRVLEATGDLRMTQKWLGHADITTTTKYAKVVDQRMRDAAAKIADLEGSRHHSTQEWNISGTGTLDKPGH